MKMKSLFFVVFILLANIVFAQANADDINGEWYNAAKDRKIQFFKSTNSTYFAKIVWLQNANDPEYKMGQVVIKGLAFKEGAYKDGQAYSPSNGGWVKATAKLNGINQLDVTGYKMIFSKTRTYTRAK